MHEQPSYASAVTHEPSNIYQANGDESHTQSGTEKRRKRTKRRHCSQVSFSITLDPLFYASNGEMVL